MDDLDKFLETLSLDPDGISQQIMSLSAFFSILFAAVMGFAVLGIYLASSSRENRDKNLYLVIPVLAVLMAVIMRINVTGARFISFFGIFGIMSIIRFRSDITDQKGITFILFAVIEGVIVGVNAYLLALLAWALVSGAILIGRYVFNRRARYRLIARSPGNGPADMREKITAWFEAHGVAAASTGFTVSSEYSGKEKAWEDRYRSEFMLYPKSEKELLAIVPEFLAAMRELNVETELKRHDA